MVKALDEGVGNITAKLTECGLDENTVIGLTADNGGQNKVGGNNWPLRGNKATLFQGGVRGTGFLWGKMLINPGRLSRTLSESTSNRSLLVVVVLGSVLEDYCLWLQCITSTGDRR